jgi:hypothetical protein
MKNGILILSLMLLGISVAEAADLRLIHVKGIHSVGARVGTALFNTFDVGVNYNYCLHRRWVLNTGLDYEQGKFGQSLFRGITVSPGAEFAVWQPCNWLFLNLTANINLAWDEWEHRDLSSKEDAFSVGGVLGINFEAYVSQHISVLLAAQQNFMHRCETPTLSGEFYCRPLFSLGVRAHIR